MSGPSATASFRIREARPAEHVAIGDLVVRSYRGVGEIDESYFDELRDVAARAAVVPVIAAIEEGSGRVLGAVTYVPGLGPFHEGELGDAASIRMLAVEPDARGRGIGRALVEECIRRARDEGRTRISLYTRPFMTAAHRMYERLGFKRVHRLDWEFEPGEWLYAYAKDLT